MPVVRARRAEVCGRCTIGSDVACVAARGASSRGQPGRPAGDLGLLGVDRTAARLRGTRLDLAGAVLPAELSGAVVDTSDEVAPT